VVNKYKKNIGSGLAGVWIGGYEIDVPSVKADFSTLGGVLTMVVDLLSFLVGFSALVAVIMIIYAGFLFITAGGDPDKISTGSKTLTAAIVGLVIVFLAKTIITFIITEFLL